MKRLTTFMFLSLLTFSVFAQNVKTFIPERALTYLPTLNKEVDRLLPNFSHPHYFGGLIEHESCISLNHSRCWSPTSELKTSRELGRGLGQLTKAYHADGSIRFDSLKDLRAKHMSELRELSWDNIKQRPDLQMRGIILMSKDNYNALYNVKDPFQRLAMTDAAYNGGLGAVNKARRECGLRKTCDDQVWFDNTEMMPVKSTKPLYGGRSATDIWRHHVRDVLYTRMPKYEPHFKRKEIKSSSYMLDSLMEDLGQFKRPVWNLKYFMS